MGRSKTASSTLLSFTIMQPEVAHPTPFCINIRLRRCSSMERAKKVTRQQGQLHTRAVRCLDTIPSIRYLPARCTPKHLTGPRKKPSTQKYLVFSRGQGNKQKLKPIPLRSLWISAELGCLFPWFPTDIAEWYFQLNAESRYKSFPFPYASDTCQLPSHLPCRSPPQSH